MKPHLLIAILLLAASSGWSSLTYADPSADNRYIFSLKKNPERFPANYIARIKLKPSQSVRLAGLASQAFPARSCEIIGLSHQYLSKADQNNYFSDLTARVIYFQPERAGELVRCAVEIDPWKGESIVLSSLLQAPNQSGAITQAAYDAGASLEMVSNAVTMWMRTIDDQNSIELEAELTQPVSPTTSSGQ